MSGAILVKRTSESGIPYNAPAGSNVGELSQFYLQGDVKALGNITGATALDFTDANVIRNQFSGTLTGNVTFAFTDPPAPMMFHVVLTQDGTGGRTVAWPAAVEWLNGASAPSMPTTAGDEAIYSFLFTGSRYIGQAGVLGFATLFNYILGNGRALSWSDDGSFNSANYMAGIGPAGNFGTANSLGIHATGGIIPWDHTYFQENVGIGVSGVSSNFGSGTKVLAVADGTAPTGAVTGTCLMYANSVAGSDACMHFLTADGKTIKLKQQAKASYNNWAALSDVVNALVATGLFDQA